VLPSVDYTVTLSVPVDVAFRAFQNLERLLDRGIYEEAIWTEGAPWQVGSRIRYRVTQPVKATITAVITAISAPRSIDIINHALGVTVEQHVAFGPDLKGGTRIRMTMTPVGTSTELTDDEAKKALTFITHDALDTVIESLQRRRNQASGT